MTLEKPQTDRGNDESKDLNSNGLLIPESLRVNGIEFDANQPSEIDGYRRKILTGMRPSGQLHLGHYVGALRNWLDFQSTFDSTFLIADLHALADNMDRTEYVRACIKEVVLDWLAVGLDPEKTNFVVQTGIPELENLTVLFETLVPFSVLQRNPTLKNELARMGDSQKTVSFHNYPISEAADILGPMGDLVPAGDDQRPMIELTRQIAKRFNKQFGEKANFQFPLPQIYTGSTGRLPGTDGNDKMGKSLNNAINLADPEEVIKQKVKKMKSIPKGLNDPGETDGHLVFTYLDAFALDKAELDELKTRYIRGGVGEGTIKDYLFQQLKTLLNPIRQRRLEIQNDNPDYVDDAILTGTRKVRVTVQQVLETVRDAMGLFKTK